MHSKRFARLCFVALLGASLVADLGNPPPAGAATQAHTFNLALGDDEETNEGNTASTVIWAVASANPKPVVVVLQEVCNNYFIWIDAHLRSYGYQAANTWLTQTDFDSPPRCVDQKNGNAIFTLGAYAGRSTFEYSSSGSLPAQDPGDTEKRDVVCMKTNIFVIITACSTHLDNNDPYTQRQANELLFHVQAQYANFKRVVGGDFNLKSFELQPGWRDIYDDPNHQAHNPALETATNNGAIDYLLVDAIGSTAPWGAIVSPGPFSDHHYYNGGWHGW